MTVTKALLGEEKSHEDEQKRQRVGQGHAGTGVTVFARTGVDASINWSPIYENWILALVPVPLGAGTNRDESVCSHVHANDFGAVMRKDSEPLSHGCLPRDT